MEHDLDSSQGNFILVEFNKFTLENNIDFEGNEAENSDFAGIPNEGDRSEAGHIYGNSDGTAYIDRDTGDVGIDYEDLEDMCYGIQAVYRSRYQKLTDSNVIGELGRFDRTIDRIGRRIAKSPDDVIYEIENWH